MFFIPYSLSPFSLFLCPYPNASATAALILAMMLREAGGWLCLAYIGRAGIP